MLVIARRKDKTVTRLIQVLMSVVMTDER